MEMGPSGPCCNWEWHIESHYPTQAKVRLEWGTQHLLPVWQKLWFARRTQTRIRQGLTQSLTARLKSCPDTKHSFFRNLSRRDDRAASPCVFLITRTKAKGRFLSRDLALS